MSDAEYDGYKAWKSWDAKSFATCDGESAAYFAKEMAASGVTLASHTKTVEIGFGNAAFAAWAVAQGADYTGLEAIAELVELGRSRGLNAHFSDKRLTELFATDSVDSFVAFDVFEHIGVAELRTMLADALVCLKPGGLVVARMPSGDSPFSRAIQHGDITHKTVLGSSAIRQIAQAEGFRVLTIRAPAFPIMGGGFGSILRRSAVAMGRALIYPLVTRVLMGGGEPVLSPNILCVLQKPS